MGRGAELASERNEQGTIRSVQIRAYAVRIYIYIHIYYIGAYGPIRSLRRGGLFIDIHPNNPSQVLGMLVGCVATDTSRSN